MKKTIGLILGFIISINLTFAISSNNNSGNSISGTTTSTTNIINNQPNNQNNNQVKNNNSNLIAINLTDKMIKMANEEIPNKYLKKEHIAYVIGMLGIIVFTIIGLYTLPTIIGPILSGILILYFTSGMYGEVEKVTKEYAAQLVNEITPNTDIVYVADPFFLDSKYNKDKYELIMKFANLKPGITITKGYNKEITYKNKIISLKIKDKLVLNVPKYLDTNNAVINYLKNKDKYLYYTLLYTKNKKLDKLLEICNDPANQYCSIKNCN